jgi:hypothetical protein
MNAIATLAHRHCSRYAVITTAMLVSLAACADSSPSTMPTSVPSLAKGGGATTVSVSAVKPDSATQDTTLDVVITGSGFTSDMDATWQLGGISDPTTVRTNSTTFVSSRQLVANITISATATPALYDVAVTPRGGGKGGVGTEVFVIKVKPNEPAQTSTWEFERIHSDGSSTRINGDGRAADGLSLLDTFGMVSGVYSNGQCGTKTRLFVWEGEASGDATMDPDAEYSTAMNCTRRSVRLEMSTGVVMSGGFLNARELLSITQVGGTINYPMRFPMDLATCGMLVFGNVNGPGTSEGRANSTATRLPDLPGGQRVWILESTPPHEARCYVTVKRNSYFTGPVEIVPFRIRITENITGF